MTDVEASLLLSLCVYIFAASLALSPEFCDWKSICLEKKKKKTHEKGNLIQVKVPWTRKLSDSGSRIGSGTCVRGKRREKGRIVAAI